MPRYIFSYRSAKDFNALADPNGDKDWRAFIGGVVGPVVVEPGWPVFEPTTLLGETGEGTQLGGYSVVNAGDLESAIALAKQSPTMTRRGGVEIGVAVPLPADHPAEQARSRIWKE